MKLATIFFIVLWYVMLIAAITSSNAIGVPRKPPHRYSFLIKASPDIDSRGRNSIKTQLGHPIVEPWATRSDWTHVSSANLSLLVDRLRVARTRRFSCSIGFECRSRSKCKAGWEKKSRIYLRNECLSVLQMQYGINRNESSKERSLGRANSKARERETKKSKGYWEQALQIVIIKRERTLFIFLFFLTIESESDKWSISWVIENVKCNVGEREGGGEGSMTTNKIARTPYFVRERRERNKSSWLWSKWAEWGAENER